MGWTEEEEDEYVITEDDKKEMQRSIQLVSVFSTLKRQGFYVQIIFPLLTVTLLSDEAAATEWWSA